jgi:hypothetical protein
MAYEVYEMIELAGLIFQVIFSFKAVNSWLTTMEKERDKIY